MSEPLIVLAQLRGGEAAAAGAAIAALDEPFADIPGTHVGRIQVLHLSADRPYLLLAADHDGPVEEWLAAAARRLHPALAHCAFWPGPDNPAEVVRWARERELQAGFSIVGSATATVQEVGDALELQAWIRGLAALEGAELRAAWEQGR